MITRGKASFVISVERSTIDCIPIVVASEKYVQRTIPRSR